MSLIFDAALSVEGFGFEVAASACLGMVCGSSFFPKPKPALPTIQGCVETSLSVRASAGATSWRAYEMKQ